MATWADYADLSIKATRDTFGVAVTYTPQGLPAESITAVYDAAHAAVELQAGVAVSSQRPVLDVRLADLTVAPRIGDTLTVASIAYEVTDVQLTGNGSAKLVLAT